MAKIVISFDGAERIFAYNPTDKDTHQKLKHNIVLTSAEEKLEDSFTGNTTYEAYVTPGDWNVKIDSWLDNEIYATGSKDVVLKLGLNNKTIPMYEAFFVTFKSNNGSAIPQQIVPKNGYAIEPSPSPTRTYYNFDGWYKNSGLTTPFNFKTDIITQKITTIYAKWKQDGTPNITNTPLSLNAYGVKTFYGNSKGNINLNSSDYGYEIWTGENDNKLTWYGPNQGGGAAFKAEWTNSGYYIGRVGYYWDTGGPYTQYKNMYADFNYTRSGTAGSYSMIGVYGWARNPTASNPNERLIAYHIVEDKFSGSMGGGDIVGSYILDGATYNVTKQDKTDDSIDDYTTFTLLISTRQIPRQTGTISITEHFKKWDGMGIKLGNMYETKFFVQVGGGTGWLDLTYLRLSQEDKPR